MIVLHVAITFIGSWITSSSNDWIIDTRVYLFIWLILMLHFTFMGSWIMTHIYVKWSWPCAIQLFCQILVYNTLFFNTFSGLEEFNSDKSKCQEHFDVYKECKRREREARLERNKNRSLFSWNFLLVSAESWLYHRRQGK